MNDERRIEQGKVFDFDSMMGIRKKPLCDKTENDRSLMV